MVDDFELISYTLKDFTVNPSDRSSALVTYWRTMKVNLAGQTAKSDSIFGEVWTRKDNDNDWKALYLQETYIQAPTAN